MNKPILKSIKVFLLLAFLLPTSVSAQEQIANFLQGNLNDAKKLGTAYLDPFGKALGTSLNGGWYQAARPHKLLGFNVTFVANVVTIPSDAKAFDVSKLSLQNIELVDPTKKMSPTVAGASSNGPAVMFKDNNSMQFNLPQGANLPFVPMTMIQAGIGLPFHNELTVRYLPSVNVPKNGRVNLWGIGLKNEFKEFIPGLKLVPIDLSVMVGYTKFSSEFDVSFKPGAGELSPTSSYQLSDFNGQKLALEASSFTTRLLVGKTIPFLSVYAGLGYSQAITEFGLKGNYAIGLDKPYEDEDIKKDPLLLEFPYSGFSANAGMRLRLGVISFNFDYTIGQYALYSAGLGISFR
jgi:hypothetical protein